MNFMEDNVGLTCIMNNDASYVGLFSLFWSITLLREIVCETNWYVGSLDNKART